MTFDAIAELNKEGYLFFNRCNEVQRCARSFNFEERDWQKKSCLNREYPTVWSDFSMEVVDKTYFDE